MAEEKFKTTLMGGFDKDDVLHQVREMKDAAYAEKCKLIKEKKDQEKVQEELARICGLPEENVRITEKEAEQ